MHLLKMSSRKPRRRRSDDFTDSISEYQRQVLEKKNSNSDALSCLKNSATEKKVMVKVKANETISADTTIFNQVSSLRSKVNLQKQNLERASKAIRTPRHLKSEISKASELKQDQEEPKSTVETPRTEPSKLWGALSTFNRSLNTDKNGLQSHQKVLSRLSQEFHSSPTKFAEKLVMIIEESMLPSVSDQKDCSGISVGRMTTEFRKLCKFIEDESMPEWILSPDVILEQDEEEYEQIENQSIEFLDESNFDDSIIETFSSTPFENKCIQKNAINSGETPKGIFKVKESPLGSGKIPFNKTIKSTRFNETNNSFEYWETMCNGVYTHQRISPQKLRRSISLPNSPATKLNKIRRTCEHQLASLDDTAIDQMRNKQLSYFHDFTGESFQSKTLEEENTRSPINKKYFSEQTRETKKSEKIENRTNKASPKKRKSVLGQYESIGRYSPNCEDDLDKSLIAELAQRRQRCFETAKLMMEIDRNDPIMSDKKDIAELLSKLGSPNKSLSLPDNNTEFLNTINHCMNYQDFLLKKRKSIIQFIQHPKYSDTDPGMTVEANSKVESPIVSGTLKTPVKNEIKSVEKKITKSSKGIKSEERKATNFSSEVKGEGKKTDEKKGIMSSRRRFFFTPGTSPKTEEKIKKKEYFPQVDELISIQSTLNFGKSPRIPEARKNIYENVRSPIAEYIKGTDTKLVKNIHAKTNDWLLTPQPLGISNESNENRITPLKSTQESSALKFNLSPMRKKITESPAFGDENIPEKEFKLPKIDYKSPAKVHTIKENCKSEPRSQGLRVKTLLKSAEKKVVIRHEGRVPAVGQRNADEDETDNKLMDTSVHVKTIARKTDSIRARTVR